VPFHLRKAKPIRKPKQITTAKFGLKKRALMAAFGAFIVVVGEWRFSHGILFAINFYGMPFYSGAVIATGACVVLLAVIPISWIDRMVAWVESDQNR